MEELLRRGLQQQQGQYGRGQATWADQVLPSTAAWDQPIVRIDEQLRQVRQFTE